MENKHRVYKKLHMRLTIYLPVMIAIFMLVAASLVFHFTPNIFLPPDIPLAAYYKPITGWIYLMTAFALIAGIILAWGISKHLEKLTIKAEGLIFHKPGQVTEISALNEVDALGIILDKATISLNKFIQDSQILDSLPEAVVTINPEGEITILNERGGKLLSLDPIEAKGKKIQDLIPETGANRLFHHLIKEGFEGRETPPREVTVSFKEKEGQTLWVGVSLFKGEITVPGGVMIIFKDPMDIKSIRNQIQRLEQLAAIGTMASGIAHEVRNPLGSIRGLTELIGEDMPPDDPKRTYVGEVLNQVDGLNRLIEDVLTFSKGSLSRAEEVDVTHILGQSVSLARHNFPDKEVNVGEGYQPELPKIEVDAERLTRAFLNLIMNAFEATPEKGWINITAREEITGAGEQKLVIIDICDFGPGIPPENMDKIFEPFYTTKKKGTGLGLTISYNIIAAHGGNIEVYSQPEKGTTFQVILPAKL